MNREDSRGFLLRFFSNPLVGGIGSIASLLGLAAAIYFFIASQEMRKLTYFVRPIEASVAKTGQSSLLRILFDGSRIEGEISAAQVVIWNQGKRSIRPDTVLEEIRIKSTSGKPILESTIRKVSRDVCRIKLHRGRLAEGKLGITWRVLEKNDGAIIEVIYSGSPDEEILLGGTIEGQAEIERRPFGGNIRSPAEQRNSLIRPDRRVGWLFELIGLLTFVLIGILTLVLGLKMFRSRKEPFEGITDAIIRTRGNSALTLVGLGIFDLALSAYFLLNMQGVGPPFAFE